MFKTKTNKQNGKKLGKSFKRLSLDLGKKHHQPNGMDAEYSLTSWSLKPAPCVRQWLGQNHHIQPMGLSAWTEISGSKRSPAEAVSISPPYTVLLEASNYRLNTSQGTPHLPSRAGTKAKYPSGFSFQRREGKNGLENWLQQPKMPVSLILEILRSSGLEESLEVHSAIFTDEESRAQRGKGSWPKAHSSRARIRAQCSLCEPMMLSYDRGSKFTLDVTLGETGQTPRVLCTVPAIDFSNHLYTFSLSCESKTHSSKSCHIDKPRSLVPGNQWADQGSRQFLSQVMTVPHAIKPAQANRSTASVSAKKTLANDS